MKKNFIGFCLILFCASSSIQAMDWISAGAKTISDCATTAFQYAPKSVITCGALFTMITLIALKKRKKNQLKKGIALKAFNKLKTLKNLTPANVVLLWDLHGVFSAPDFAQIGSQVWNDGATWHAIQAVCSPGFYGAINKFRKSNNRCYEHLHRDFIKNTNLKHHEEMVMSLIHAQKPMLKTIEFFKKIKASGKFADHMLFTNNGAQSHQAICKKPGYEFLNKFSHSFIVSGIGGGKTQANQTILKSSKPHAPAFNEVLTVLKTKHPGKTVILIDDGYKNVRAANDNNMNSLMFSSVEQLQKDLKELKLWDASQPEASSSR